MSGANSTYTRSIAIAALAAAVALVVLFTGGDRGSTAAPVSGQAGSALARADAARAEARAHVAALRRPRSATRDALPLAVLGGPLVAQGAIDSASARRVATAEGSGWVASSGDGRSVCSVVDGALGCASLAMLVGEEIVPSIMGRAGEPNQVFGVVPDGVTDLALVHLDDRSEAVRAVDGFFVVESDDWPKSFTWENSSGPASFAFPTR